MKRFVIFLALLSVAALLAGTLAVKPHRKAVHPKRVTAAASGPAPSCTARDAKVAVPGAPHGMFVWNPYKVQGGKYEKELEARVIGKDPTLCGVSLVVAWSSVEPKKGSFDWSSIETQARPYLNAHLRLNLLFADASEVGASDISTPSWVFTQDRVAKISCPKQVDYPNFMDSKFEADWEALIAAAVKQYGSNPSVGYMRFGIGAGSEAYPGHIERPPTKPNPCYQAWVKTVHWSYKAWLKHSTNVIEMLGRHRGNKQLMIAMNYIPYSPTIYSYADSLGDAAAPRGIGFGTENLGIGHVAGPNAKPGKCNPQGKKVNLYWCQAFTNHAGKVPLEFQPIAATTPGSTQGYDLNISKLLQYALANKAQILELYPQEWLATDNEHKSALRATAQVLGTAH